MEQHSIKNVKNPFERFDEVNKAYVDHFWPRIGQPHTTSIHTRSTGFDVVMTSLRSIENAGDGKCPLEIFGR